MKTSVTQDEIVVNVEERCIQIFVRGNNWPFSTASATKLDNGKWYLNRVFINAADRNKGIGSDLLDRMKEKLSSLSDFEELMVEPGGYDADPGRQRNFYTKNGFKNHHEGYMYWQRNASKP